MSALSTRSNPKLKGLRVSHSLGIGIIIGMISLLELVGGVLAFMAFKAANAH